MSGEELLDIFDDRGQHIGTRTRDAVHLNHDWHWLVFVWCAWREDDGLSGALRMLLQQRSRPDDPYVNSLDALAGGHVGAGVRVLRR